MRREVEGRGEEPITLRRRGVELRKREGKRFSGQDSEVLMIYDDVAKPVSQSNGDSIVLVNEKGNL